MVKAKTYAAVCSNEISGHDYMCVIRLAPKIRIKIANGGFTQHSAYCRKGWKPMKKTGCSCRLIPVVQGPTLTITDYT